MSDDLIERLNAMSAKMQAITDRGDVVRDALATWIAEMAACVSEIDGDPEMVAALKPGLMETMRARIRNAENLAAMLREHGL